MTSNATRLAFAETGARAGMYHLLGRLWLCEADRTLIRELRRPPLCDLFCRAGGSIPASDDDQTIEELQVDYCRLLIGPKGHLPPFQSVWENGQFQSTTTDSMNSFVELAGYDTGRLPRRMMLDHIGVQLDVQGHILTLASNWPANASDLDEVLQVSRGFFATHLLWPTKLLDAASVRSATDFYRSSITMTRDFLQSEALTL